MSRYAVAALALLVLAISLPLHAVDNYWKGAVNTPLNWTDTANWTAGIPTATQYVYIDSDGVAVINPTNSATASYLYLGTGTHNLGGSVNQLGGSLTTNDIYLIASGSHTASYNLSAGTVAMLGAQIGGSGTNTFYQSGGLVDIQDGIDGWLGVGIAPSVIGPARAGRYELSGFSSVLNVSRLGINTLGTFTHFGGTVNTNLLDLQGNYKFTLGTLNVSRGLALSGTFDFDHQIGTFAPGNALVDLSQGSIVNANGITFNSGAKSMVLLPVGFNPAVFNTFTPGNLTHTVGSPMNITADQGWEGWGAITDHVNTAGTINPGLGITGGTQEGGLNFLNGITVTGGSVNLGGPTGSSNGDGYLLVNDPASGISAGSFLVGNMSVGSNGAGTFTQTGGTATVKSYLDVYSNGTYNLSDTGVLNVNTGFYLYGTFNQTGGTTNITTGGGFFNLGNMNLANPLSAPPAVFNLSGGTLNANAIWLASGTNSTATINHTGGDLNLTSFLLVAYGAGSVADYNLSGTGHLNAINTWESVVGYNGKGTFTQTGGVNSVGVGLRVGGPAGSEARYYLHGGVLTVGADLSIGTLGFELFDHSAGSATVGELRIATTYNGGDYYMAGLTGSYNLYGTGTLAANTEKIGHWGVGTFSHTASSNTVTGNLALGDKGQGDGTYNLSGAGSTVSAGSMTVADAGKGVFNHPSGSVSVTGNLTLGKSATGIGAYNLSGVSSTFSAGSMTVGDAGKGTFNHSDVAVALPGLLSVGQSSTGNGSYFLNSGSLSDPEARIGGLGAGKFTHSSGSHTVAGSLFLGYDSSGNGTYEMSGGTLSAADLVVGRDNLTSHGTGLLKVTNSASSITVSHALHIGQNGSLDLVTGSTIHMTGSAFENQSTNPANLATLSKLSLVYDGQTGGTDPFELAGKDFGRDSDGFTNNFALGSVTLASNADFQLVDLFDNLHRNGAGGNAEALYLDSLTMLPGSTLDLNGLHLYVAHLHYQGGSVINGSLISLMPGDANNDFRVDGADLAKWQQNYDPSGAHSATNTFAMGDWNSDGHIDGADLALWQQNYNPSGGLPQQTPEPGTLLLLGTGALSLGGLLRRTRMN